MPLEILEDIVRYTLSSGISSKVSNIASVNTVWQSIVEETTFQELRLGVLDIATAMKTLRNRPARFNLVRRIVFTVILPRYTAVDCTLVESDSDRFRNDLIFTKSIKLLLVQLSEWPSTGRTLELQLTAFSPSDARYLNGNQWVRSSFGVVLGDLLHNRTYGSTLELYGEIKKPAPIVTKLTFRDDCERYIAVSGVHRLFQAFTGLRDIDIRLWDFYKHSPDFTRRSTRRQMAKALGDMPNSVRSMRFHIKYYPPADQTFQGQRLCEGNDESDPLTVAYRNTSQKMTIVDIHGMLGTPELFWPKQVNAASPAPFWPNLKCIELYYHILDPAGEWLFEPDEHEPRRQQADLPFHDLPARYTPQEDARPMQNRFTADQKKMDEFYLAVGKAINNMPKLEHMHLQALTYWNGRLAPLHVLMFHSDGRFARAIWAGDPAFVPSNHVLKAWRRMAYERCLFLTFEWRNR
ncbi:hypothetical protein O1611_g2122 [Lasiodiplodia mahajangana]|uniref:Uncharacterized protein n=1 Tax=Lasiodiplodia mahajangana TaxID=1108764 RepID=A0ACC2JVG2_9PEZI|nr:hypothetical protein O1611_g2122 [Lasiodiplodia mahajangana]